MFKLMYKIVKGWKSDNSSCTFYTGISSKDNPYLIGIFPPSQNGGMIYVRPVLVKDFDEAIEEAITYVSNQGYSDWEKWDMSQFDNYKQQEEAAMVRDLIPEDLPEKAALEMIRRLEAQAEATTQATAEKWGSTDPALDYPDDWME